MTTRKAILSLYSKREVTPGTLVCAGSEQHVHALIAGSWVRLDVWDHMDNKITRADRKPLRLRAIEALELRYPAPSAVTWNVCAGK